MKRPILQYSCLVVLLVLSVVYQVRRAEIRFPQWFGRENQVGSPFLLDSQGEEPAFRIIFLHPNAREAGLGEGDTLVALNGRPVTGWVTLTDALAAARPGDLLLVTVRPKGQPVGSAPHTVAVRLMAVDRGNPVAAFFSIVMPAFCLTLGFWTTAVRPRDPRAWLVLAVMLSLASLGNPLAQFWGPRSRIVAVVYWDFLQNSWPVWLFLLGVYFPEPFPPGLRSRWWTWFEWTTLPLWAVMVACHVVAAVGELQHLAAVFAINRFLTRTEMLARPLAYALVAGFFVGVCAKYRMATSHDSRRRLRVLYAGAFVSLTPLLILSLIAQWHGTSIEHYFPWWVIGPAWALFCLLPVTLAYIIVVQRAMDVRVVIRQGLRYAFAKGGINLIQVIFGSCSIAAVIYVLRHVRPYSLPFFLVILVTVALFYKTRQGFQKLRLWIDRKFFRDAYDAEQLLSELADEVRTMVEVQPLLATVSQRIADSLHVERVAALVDGSGPYRPAYALGYNTLPQVVFPESAATVRQLAEATEPARVYLDDPTSWLYRRPDMSEAERRQLAELGAELLLPLAAKDHLLGFICLGPKRSEEPYSRSDIRLLKSVAVQTGLALENARLTSVIAEEVAQREKLNREIEIAREVQERLFPQKRPPVSGLDYDGACRPAQGVAGDYFDFLALPGGRLGIAIGDVSGKGISAALMMASLQASLRGEATRAPDDLAALIRHVNHLVYEATATNRYATFFYAQYDPVARQLSYVNAGHNPPLLFRRCRDGWQVQRLAEGGTVVGLLPDSSYEQASVTLVPGDVLVAYTDGVSEAMNCENEEWGEERMMDAVKSCAEQCASAMIQSIMRAADEFAAGAAQHDDMTLIVMRCCA